MKRLTGFRRQYLQHIRSMYNTEYKLGLQKTLNSEEERNRNLNRKLAALKTEIHYLQLSAQGECKYLSRLLPSCMMPWNILSFYCMLNISWLCVSKELLKQKTAQLSMSDKTSEFLEEAKQVIQKNAYLKLCRDSLLTYNSNLEKVSSISILCV